jgi:hypothetical protein
MSMARISPTNRNFIVAYILLVGVPLLGLAGVLKAGHALTAPISIDGTWALETSPATLFGQTLQNSLLTISQSGNGLVVSLNNGLNTTGTGTLAGAAMDATLSMPSTAADHCGSDATLALKATIDSKVEPRTMLGTISVKGCGSSAELSYRAVRQSRSTRKEAR